MANTVIGKLPMNWDTEYFGSYAPTERDIEILHEAFDAQLPDFVIRDGDEIFCEIEDIPQLPDFDFDEILNKAYDAVFNSWENEK